MPEAIVRGVAVALTRAAASAMTDGSPHEFAATGALDGYDFVHHDIANRRALEKPQGGLCASVVLSSSGDWHG